MARIKSLIRRFRKWLIIKLAGDLSFIINTTFEGPVTVLCKNSLTTLENVTLMNDGLIFKMAVGVYTEEPIILPRNVSIIGRRNDEINL